MKALSLLSILSVAVAVAVAAPIDEVPKGVVEQNKAFFEGLGQNQQTVPKINGKKLSQLNSVAIYTVKTGDWLSKIAETYGTTSKILQEMNGIEDPNIIFPGQKLRVPKGNTSVDKTSASAPTNIEIESPSEGFAEYLIKGGDTLIGIAQAYGTDYHYLAKINKIADPDIIYAGSVIKVPNHKK